MKDEQLFRVKVIKSENDLPKEVGLYLCHYSNSGASTEYHFLNLENNTQFWLNHFDWYLIPEEITDSDIETWAKHKENPWASRVKLTIVVYKDGLIDGAKWMRDEIIKRNK